VEYCNIRYINDVFNNVLRVDERELSSLYEDIEQASCIVPCGAGRSEQSLLISMSQLAKMRMKKRKVIQYPEGPGFPAGNMYDAASILEELYSNDGHVYLLINSGSGKTKAPLVMAEELARYIEKTGTKNFRMGLITSMPQSPIAKIVKKYGSVVRVEGRTKEEAERPLGYRTTGIMGDKFELASGFLLSTIVEGLFKGYTVEKLYGIMRREARLLGRLIDRTVESEDYRKSIDILERRSNVFGGGRGTSMFVVKTLLIRLGHVKGPLGDSVFVAGGINTPRPRAGDLGIFISYSGETQQVLNWAEQMKEMNAYVISITSQENSSLNRISDMKIVIPEGRMPGEPRWFYIRSVFITSPQPVLLCGRLEERGLPLGEDILKWYHSIME